MSRIPIPEHSSKGALAAFATAGLMVLCLFATTSSGTAQTKKPNKYIGSQKCKTCHASADTGDQFGALAKAQHAHAFETLASDEAKKIAKEKSIEDPQKADACLKCHVTAFGVADAEIARGFDKAQGVQCESCHGPGEAHMKARMAAAATEDPNAPKVHKGVPATEIVSSPPMATCTGCHNKESPNFKGFCHCKHRAMIRHLNPKRERTDAEKSALNVCTCPDDCGCKKECCKEGACSEFAKPAK